MQNKNIHIKYLSISIFVVLVILFWPRLTLSQANSSGVGQGTLELTSLTPNGIYVLGQMDDLTYQASTIQLAGVSGYAGRVLWKTLDTGTADNTPVYNWSYIDTLFTTAATYNKKVTLYVWTGHPPSHVFVAHNGTSVQTYYAIISQTEYLTPLPWDAVANEDLERFYYDLANHQVGGVAVKNRPELAAIRTDFLGLKGIRDTDSRLVNDSRYNRSTFINGILSAIHYSVDVFNSNTPILLEFHTMIDSTSDPRLDTALIDAIYNEFGNRITFFTENLNINSPSGQLQINHTRAHDYGMQNAFQAVGTYGDLDTLVICLNRGFDLYRARYYELYRLDLVNFSSEIVKWNRKIYNWTFGSSFITTVP